MGVLDGQVQIVFNGEIYNFPEIRSDLEARGHRFMTGSDTEVILLGYLEWGESCVEKLNGMFAFAIWDTRKKQLFAARDRVGKKPFYYFNDGCTFAFASELKALRAGGYCPDNIDPEALDCYFSFGYIPAPRTIYKRVKKLEPAKFVTVDSNNLRASRYWQLSFAEQSSRSLEDASDEFLSLLDKAVSCRLMSEVPLGVFLSGGLDSPLVVASMAQMMREPVQTNSIGFDDSQFNELPLAKVVADHLKTHHKEFIVRPNALDVLEKIGWHFDEPFADSSAVPTWYVCNMARENLTVVLSGDGGDESFGGYTFRYIPHLLESNIRTCLPVALRRLLFGGLGAIYPTASWMPKVLRLKTIFENLGTSDAEAFYRDLIWLRSDIRDKIYSKDFLDSLQGYSPFEEVRPIYLGGDAQSALGRSQFTDINFYMTNDVLVKVDRMSMANSIEVRSPLLDYRILEFAARLPEDLKINRRQGKLVLRKAVEQRLPEAIVNQPKRGFSVPAAHWLRNDLKPIAEHAIIRRDSLAASVLNYRTLKKIWEEHQSGARDHNVFLWGLMMLEIWEKVHFRNT